MVPSLKGLDMTAHAGGLNGQAPRCTHFAMTPSAEPGSPECAECLDLGLGWEGLLACLTCGWVACSDSSPGCHARAHYEESDHPVAVALGAEPPWRWCYVHGRAV